MKLTVQANFDWVDLDEKGYLTRILPDVFLDVIRFGFDHNNDDVLGEYHEQIMEDTDDLEFAEEVIQKIKDTLFAVSDEGKYPELFETICSLKDRVVDIDEVKAQFPHVTYVVTTNDVQDATQQ